MACVPNGTAALAIARSSSCPVSHWLDELAPTLFSDSNLASSAALFNVGANKGYAVAVMLARLGLLRGDASSWHDALVTEVAKTAPRLNESRCTRTSRCPFTCGVCGACKEAPPPRLAVTNVTQQRLHVHAFEMQPVNAAWLRTASSLFAPAGAVRVVHGVVSSRDGEACVEASQMAAAVPGVEQARSHRPPLNASLVRQSFPPELLASLVRHGCVKVPSIRLDSYMAAHSIERVAFVTIDAEGHDALVLDGLREALSRGAVDVIEFEYHHVGMWAHTKGGRSLRATLRDLYVYGYACFWQASDHGRASCELAPASAMCWDERFEIRAWSNLVCARGTRDTWPQSVLWKIAQRCA